MTRDFLPLSDPLAHLPAGYEPDVDIFAGGGGASTGFELAFGKSPDLAVNHDPEAIAMHMANHPDTVHLCQNVINVHPLQATGGRLARVLWASPDCTHFSKAKGGKPRNQNIRDLAWTVVRWLELTRPLLFGVENVEEFQSWGPLDSAGQPIKERAGEIFRQWIRRIRKLGYSVAWNELSACDFGAPTTRKRLFIIGRLDGRRVRWPKPTHGPDRAHPYRTAAECIDWSDPAPSIFERKKPLAENTQRRIAEGIRRYVIQAQKPFLVTYYGPKRGNDFRGMPVNEPLRTQGTENRFGLVAPYFATPAHSKSTGRGPGVFDPKTPLRTITGSNTHALVAPYLVQPNHTAEYYQHFRGQSMEKPLGTVTASPGFALCEANLLLKNYTGVVGQSVDKPLGTVTSIDHHSLVSACLAKLRGTNIGGPVDTPLQTISAQGTHHALVSASLIKYYGEGGQHADCDEPMHTCTAKARFGLQAVHLQQYNGCSEAQPMEDPLPTISTRDRFGLTAATLCQFNGSANSREISRPLGTLCQRDKFGLMAATPCQYNGCSGCQPLDEPMPVLCRENKFGLVECPLDAHPGHYEEVRALLRHWKVIGPEDEAEVVIDGVTLRITDIGLRMLRPRELFRANGFPDSYAIDPVYNGKPLTITSQVKKCGNSVPPQFVAAVFGANLDALKYERTPSRNMNLPLLKLQCTAQCMETV